MSNATLNIFNPLIITTKSQKSKELFAVYFSNSSLLCKNEGKIYTARCTFPALMQDVQTLILLTVPFCITFTDCRFKES